MIARSDQNADYHARIVVDSAILSGKPVIAGTRIPVSLILNLIAHGYDFERIVDAYPNLSVDDVKAAIGWTLPTDPM